MNRGNTCEVRDIILANLRAMCYTFISFALWLETQSHMVHSVLELFIMLYDTSVKDKNHRPEIPDIDICLIIDCNQL